MERENSKIDDVLKKLRKLQKLYENAKEINSEGEAAAAAARIQAILTEYNLTMDQVGESEDKEKSPMGHECTSGFTYKSIGGYWEQKLFSTLCQFNYCKCLLVNGSYKKLILVGEKHNVEIVRWLKDVLARVFVNLSNDRWKEFKGTLEHQMNPMCKEKFQRSYLIGAVQGLYQKLYEEREAEKKKTEQVTALVLCKDKALQEYMGATFGKLGTTNKGNKIGSHTAQSMGYKDGKDVNINKAVDSTAKPRKELA